MEYFETLACNLKQARLFQGLTLSALAQRSGIAKSTLSRLETGEGNPTIDTLWALADALKVPFGDLVVGGEGSLPESPSAGEHGASVRFMERSVGEILIETYRMELPAGHVRHSEGHAEGVRERVVMLSGSMLAGSTDAPERLAAGESCEYAADGEHLYGALDSAAVAMVFIEYPGQTTSQQLADQVIHWPESSEQWQSFRSLLQRMAAETAAGFQGTLLGLRSAPLDAGEVREAITADTRGDPDGNRTIMTVTGRDAGGAFWAAFPRAATSAFAANESPGPSAGLLSDAWWLAGLAESPALQHSAVISGLQQQRESLTLECLLSDIALQHGVVRMPGTSGPVSPGQSLVSREMAGASGRPHADRYVAYEVLHPACARQVVAMADAIQAYGVSRLGGQAIEVGSGAGMAMLMLCELVPGLSVRAVAPDGPTLGHLEAVASIEPRIQPQKKDVLAGAMPAASQDLLLEMGAAHHPDMALMLRQSHQLLRPGGLLCMAGEFLPEYQDRHTYLQALVRHHGTSILSTATFLACCERTTMSPALWEDYADIKASLSLALLAAQRGWVEDAVDRCRALSMRLNERVWHVSERCPFAAYLRLVRLEVQAMVTGFEGEGAPKTHVQRFLAMARMSGFRVVAHKRVFATSGLDEWQGGSHVVTLQKPEGY
ncbi:helix-turn-helix domain-containing protein [Halomonadaceae bacterium KBTZ08]